MSRHAPPQLHVPRHVSLGLLLALALTSLAVGTAWSTAAVAHVERTQELVTKDAWVEHAELRYLAPVVNGTPGFENGTVLGMGEPGYLTTIAPRLHVQFRWNAIDPGAATTVKTAQLAAEVIVESAGNAPLRVRHTLADASTVAGTLRLEGVLDVPEMEKRLKQEMHARGIRDGRTTWSLVGEVAWTREDGASERSAFPVPMRHDAPLYVLPPPDELTWIREHAQREVHVHESRAGVANLAAEPRGPLLLALGTAGLAVAVARSARAHPEEASS